MIETIIGILSALIVQGLKKIKLPTKYAPIVVFILAVIGVAIARVFGIVTDITTLSALLFKALGIAGATALTYDQIKALLIEKTT